MGEAGQFGVGLLMGQQFGGVAVRSLELFVRSETIFSRQ